MKTIITSLLLTALKLTFLLLIFISASPNLDAQNKLSRTYLQMDYTKNSDGSKSLSANIRFKENRKFVAIKNETIRFYTGEDLDELIKEVATNFQGEASILVPEEIEADSLGYFYFSAEFEGTEKLKRAQSDLSLKDARLELSFNQESEGRTITVNAFEINNENEKALSDEDVLILIPTLFGDMQIGSATLEEGICTVEFPSDLPGDSLGNLQIIVKIEDSDDFGNVVKMDEIPWGIAKSSSQVEEVNVKGKLWTHNAPLWMVVTLLILVVGVWSHFGYIIYKLYKINIDGSQKAVV